MAAGSGTSLGVTLLSVTWSLAEFNRLNETKWLSIDIWIRGGASKFFQAPGKEHKGHKLLLGFLVFSPTMNSRTLAVHEY